MTDLMIIHPDPQVRAHLVKVMLDNDDLGPDIDFDIDEAPDLETAALREPRPDVMLTHLPTARDKHGQPMLPDRLLFVPNVMVIEDHEPMSLGWALTLGPAGVVLPDSDPGLIRGAVVAAMHNAGIVLDNSLAAVAAELLRMSIEADEEEAAAEDAARTRAAEAADTD